MAAGALIALALTIGCGDSESETTPPAETTLLLPEETVFGSVREVDLVAARDQLGLPADANPRAAGGGEAGLRLTELAETAMPFVGPPQFPVGEAIDGGQVESAAINGLPGASSVIVLRTTQPFDEIATALVKEGYKRAGEVISWPGNPNEVVYAEIAGGEDGIVAISLEPNRASEALAQQPADPGSRPELELLGELPAAPVRFADSSPDLGDCVTGVALAEQAAADEESELLLRIDGEADAERFGIEEGASGAGNATALGSSDQFEFGEAEAEDDLVRVPFTLAEDAPGSAIDALEDLFFAEAYRC